MQPVQMEKEIIKQFITVVSCHYGERGDVNVPRFENVCHHYLESGLSVLYTTLLSQTWKCSGSLSLFLYCSAAHKVASSSGKGPFYQDQLKKQSFGGMFFYFAFHNRALVIQVTSYETFKKVVDKSRIFSRIMHEYFAA